MKAKFETTTKGSGIVVNPPHAQAIKYCLEFPESAHYTLKRLIETLTSVGLLEKGDDLIEKVREFVEVVDQQNELRELRKPWEADAACERTDFQNLQIKLAAEARELMAAAGAAVLKMDYALSDSAKFLRGYSANGKPLKPELLDSCDTLFNAWLAENNLLSKGGQIYEVTEDGKIKEDDKGKPITAHPDRVKTLLNDPTNSFEAFLANSKKAIQLTSQEHPYPAEKPKAKPAVKAREEAPKAGPAAAEPTKPQPDQEGGVTPSSGGGAASI